jgi:restriction endonuclease
VGRNAYKIYDYIIGEKQMYHIMLFIIKTGGNGIRPYNVKKCYLQKYFIKKFYQHKKTNYAEEYIYNKNRRILYGKKKDNPKKLIGFSTVFEGG